MIKDYKKWMPIKSSINNNEKYPIGFKKRDVWVCNLGENIGFEEDGKGDGFTRPVLILKVFNRKFCYVVPLSTTDKRGKYYFPFQGKTGKISVAVISQTRSIDSSRLLRRIGMINKQDFKNIKENIKITLNL